MLSHDPRDLPLEQRSDDLRTDPTSPRPDEPPARPGGLSPLAKRLAVLLRCHEAAGWHNMWLWIWWGIRAVVVIGVTIPLCIGIGNAVCSLYVQEVHPNYEQAQIAGWAVARLALAVAPHAQRIWIAAGGGNNGGDGLIAARHLLQAGRTVQVRLFGDPARAPADEAERERKPHAHRKELLGVERQPERAPRDIEHPADDANEQQRLENIRRDDGRAGRGEGRLRRF